MNQNRKIDMKGLIRAIFLKWPLLLAAVLVFGGLGCGKYYRANHNSASEQETSTEEKNSTTGDKNYNQAQKEAIDREIKWLNQFIDESPANKIDSYHAGYASATLYIDGGNAQITGSNDGVSQGRNNNSADSVEENGISVDPQINMAVESLRTFLTSGIDWSDEKKKFDVAEDAYLYDLMNIRISGNTITVSFWYDSPENAETVLDDVISQTTEEFGKIKESQNLDGYSIRETVSGSTTKVLTDSDNWVTQRITQLKNLASSIENSNAVKTADDSISGSSNSVTKPVFSSKAMIKSGLKYGLAGFVIMAFLLILWILKKGYVLSDEEFTANTGIQSVGKIAGSYQNLDVENLKAYLKHYHSDQKKTAVVTDLSDIKSLSQFDKDSVFSTLLSDPNAREKLNEYDSAVICFRTVHSGYKDLNEIISILKSRGLSIIGSVILE